MSTNPSVSEAETTLQDLINKLEGADDKEAELTASSKEIAFDAIVNGGPAKVKMEKLQAEITKVQGHRVMLSAAIDQAEANLTKAKATEATRIAQKEANEARAVAAELTAIGAEMNSALDAFIGGYRQFQAATVQMKISGFPVYGHLDLGVQFHLIRSLQSAGFDIPVYTGPGERGQNFETILAGQEALTRRKTAPVLGEVLEPAKVAEVQAVPLLNLNEPFMTFSKQNNDFITQTEGL
jgi:hypothetical protein